MKDFLKHSGEFLQTYPKIKLRRIDEAKIQECVLGYLGLNDIFQLKDRFEGQAFFDKTLKKIGALISVQKHLDLPLSDIEKIKLNDYTPKIVYKNQIIDICVFDFGSLPAIDSNNIINTTIFVIQKDRLSFSICGYATPQLIHDNLIDGTFVLSKQANSKNFIGFKYLKPALEIL